MNAPRLAAALATAWLAGCSALTVPVTLPKAADQAQPQRITDVVALWQPGEGTTPDGLPCRGFAGQVMFFEAGSDSPVAVDGSVRIYVFDDHGDDASKPLHVFNFDPGAWGKYRCQTKLGTSYQVFVPYTREGSHRASCSVRVRFENDKSRLLSDAAGVVLDGSTRPQDQPRLAENNRPMHPVPNGAIVQASYTASEMPDDPITARMPDTDTRLDRIERMLEKLAAADEDSPLDPTTSPRLNRRAASSDRPPLQVHTIPIRSR